MRSNKKTVSSAAVCVAVLALGGSAPAATETFTATVPSQTTDFAYGTTLAQFNPALGTLTGVTIGLSSSGTMGGNVTNTSGGVATFQVTETSNISLTSTNSGITGLTGLNQPLTETQTYTNLAVSTPTAFGPYTPNAGPFTVSETVGPTFIGTGTLPFTFNTLTGTQVIGGGGNLSNSIMTTAAGSATITYTYTASTNAVPEPASLILGLTSIAGGGLTWFIRRRKRGN